MPKTIEAVYENGILKPIGALKLKEHQLVKVTITPVPSRIEVPAAVKKIIDYLSGPLPIRSEDDLIRDTQIDAD